ncbi:hypothetical protein [Vibrio phage vB_VpS_PG28]|nr:hypothetical protein [Vibrio phage vB_VpS_PG28]
MESLATLQKKLLMAGTQLDGIAVTIRFEDTLNGTTQRLMAVAVKCVHLSHDLMELPPKETLAILSAIKKELPTPQDFSWLPKDKQRGVSNLLEVTTMLLD